MLMKIVILDGFTANPGDLSWKPLEEIGEVTVYDRTPPSETVSRAADAEVIVTNKVIISKDVMQQLPKLKYVGVAATGYNVVDLKYASERNIVVTNIPAYSTASVAQMTVAQLLNATNRVALHADSVSKGEWQSSKDFCYWLPPQRELAGETFGIIGLGNTGLATAKIVLALGMKVLALTSKTQEILPEGITKAKNIDDLMRNSDVISLHCPLTPDTEHIINKVNIAKMKRNAIIINTGRGPLVDEQAVAEALREGRTERQRRILGLLVPYEREGVPHADVDVRAVVVHDVALDAELRLKPQALQLEVEVHVLRVVHPGAVALEVLVDVVAVER